MEIVTEATRTIFFTGKGGVGKTSVACAKAVRLADAGRRVLLISTDPASNLDEVSGGTLGASPRDVPGVARLRALNIDSEASARAYHERIVGPYRGVLPAEAVASMEEQFSGSCTLDLIIRYGSGARRRRAEEARYLEEVLTKHAARAALIPWQLVPPIGVDRLREPVAGSPGGHDR